MNLNVVSLASPNNGICLLVEGKHGLSVIDSGRFTLPALAKGADLSRIRYICVTDFTQDRAGDAAALVAACEEVHRKKKNIREIRLMGPEGIAEKLKKWESINRYFCFPVPVMVANGCRWFWNVKSFEVPGKMMGYIHYYNVNKTIVFLPRVAAAENIDPLVDIKYANLLVAGLASDGIDPAQLRRRLRYLQPRKVLIIPGLGKVSEDIKSMCTKERFVIAKEGMTISAG